MLKSLTHQPLRKAAMAAALSLATLMAGMAGAYASGDNMIVGGGQVGGQNSTYGTAGLITPLPGTAAGDGWVDRLFAEEVSYRYKAAGGRIIDGRAYGGNAAVGYQVSDEDGWLGAYVGPSLLHTSLSPNDPANKSRGFKVSARFQVEGEYNIADDFKINGNTSYEAFQSSAYWARLRALYRLDGSIYLGPEGVVQGDDNYKAWQAGLALVGVPVTEQATVGFDAGIHKTQGFSYSPYGGMEFGVNF